MYKIKQIKKSKFGYGSKTDEDCILIRLCDKAKPVNIEKFYYLIRLLKYRTKNILLICDNLENINLVFLSYLCRKGYSITLQANGSTRLDYSFRVYLDSIILIPKSEKLEITRCDDLIIKFPHFSEKTAIKLGEIDCLERYISPCSGFFYKSNVNRCINFISAHSDWKMSLPTHRI